MPLHLSFVAEDGISLKNLFFILQKKELLSVFLDLYLSLSLSLPA